MKKKIFIIGQATLHWGRLEFGNIGNFYIVKPLFTELRRIFPDAEFITTMQFSERFCSEFDIQTIPMEAYYDFKSNENLQDAIKEYEGVLNGGCFSTPYIDVVRQADLVIDFSGDIWGDNADFLGKDRFITGCYKDLTAQLLKPTIMIAGSPGPFSGKDKLEIAKKAYRGFSFVSNREAISTRMLMELGFDMAKTYTFPCPSFLFIKSDDLSIGGCLEKYFYHKQKKLRIGFILCGWNFQRAPFNAWPRQNSEYNNFV